MYAHEAHDEDGRAAATRGAVARVAVVVLLLAVGAVAASAAAAPAAADHGEEDEFVATQGDDCVELAVLGDGTQSVAEFYDYRWQDGHRYASYGTTHLQRTSTSQLFAYHGADGVSLVFLHDELGDEAGGGAVSMAVDGLPEGDWPVMDDSYPEPDDEFEADGATAQIDWMYAPNRTDGGAFRGLENLGDDGAIGIDPAFGEESYAATERNWPWAEGDLEWYVRHGEGAGDLEGVSETERLEVRRGTCGDDALEAYLTASPSEPTVGEQVALEASTSADAGTVEAYRWDVDGDGEVDRTTDEPETTLVYDDAGTVEPSVTVVTGEDEASASASVDVGADVTARASADAETVSVGDAVAFDGTDSTVAGADATYEWDLDDGTSASGPTTEHAFDAPGTYVVDLVVTADDGTNDVATVEVAVEADGDGGGDGDQGDGEDGDGGEGDGDQSDGDEGDGEDGDGSENDSEDAGDGENERGGENDDGSDGDDGDGDDGDGSDTDDENGVDGGESDGGDSPFDGGDGSGGDGSRDDSSGDGNGDDDSDDADSPLFGEGGDPSASASWRDDGALTVRVEDATAGERVTAAVPDGGPSQLAAVEVVPAADAATWTATLSAAEDPSGPGGGVALDELSPGDADAEAVTYEYAIDAGAVPGPTEDLAVVEHDGEAWRTLETSVEDEGETLRVRASSDGLRRVVLASVADDGGASGDVRLVDLTVDEDAGDDGAVVVNATYRNDGWTAADADATLTVDGETVAERSVAVAAGESATVTFERALGDGEHTVAVGDEERTVEGGEEPRTRSSGWGIGGVGYAVAGLVGLLVAVVAIGRVVE